MSFLALNIARNALLFVFAFRQHIFRVYLQAQVYLVSILSVYASIDIKMDILREQCKARRMVWRERERERGRERKRKRKRKK